MPTKKPPNLTAPTGQRQPLHLQARQSKATAGQTRAKAREFARMSRQPLTKQDTSDAWNERQNRLIAGRTAARMHLMASYKRGAGDKTRDDLDWR